jgi:hypothetical protein
MAHISELALFQYLAGEAELTSEQLAHLSECDDCEERAVEFRRVISYSGDISKAKRVLVEEEELPTPEPPEEQDHPHLDKRAG